jgi:uncharacterized protein YceH (UPF0502 family)
MHLNQIELRVLGALTEKEITTPENYPLSLNALVNACNQRSSRDPVLDLDEEQVRRALHTLEERGLVSPYRDARVTKYEHRIRTVLNLRRDETALLCLLLLRGPQTPGELRTRADRMYTFDDLAAVIATLDRLAARPETGSDSSASSDASATGPLVALRPRQPGAREARYTHLLGGPVSGSAAIQTVTGLPAGRAVASENPADGELQALRERVDQLVDSIELMEARIARLENQR